MKRHEPSPRRGRRPPEAAAVPAARVLAVDDTAVNLHLLSELLERHDYHVRAVTSGRDALLAVEAERPDLILLDIDMPDMDGYEVCRRLKASDESKDIPVIFLTSLTGTADKVRAFEIGAADYVTKPFRFEEVLARVRTHVAFRRAQAALADSYERLHALEQLRDDLVRMIVHDMRSPLMVLHTHLTLLKVPVAALGRDDRQDLQAAIDAAQVITQMTNDLLDVSRLEERRMPIEPVLCDLTQIATDVRAALLPLDPERPIDVESPGATPVTCDAALIRRVLENLVSNGIRHTPPGSRIRISLDHAEGRVRVAVHDDGPGVPAEAREKIFEKFGTMATRLDRSYQSIGLGLAFCKLAIEAQGGTIGVEPGVPAGSTFWFELPA